jgi:hypothetical protein
VGKRNFGDCEWIFERAVVEALGAHKQLQLQVKLHLRNKDRFRARPISAFVYIFRSQL